MTTNNGKNGGEPSNQDAAERGAVCDIVKRGRPNANRGERFPGYRVRPGTTDKIRAAAEILNISQAEALELAAELLKKEAERRAASDRGL